MQRISIHYAEARGLIEDADVLLFRSRGGIWGLIAKVGRSEFTHVGVAGWWHNRVMLLEMTNKGGRATLLSNTIKEWPGIVDVYRLRRSTDTTQNNFQEGVISAMLEITNKRYGKWHLLKTSLYHTPFIRLLMKPKQNDKLVCQGMPFCSEVVSRAYRRAGFDLVPNLADCVTEPADIARSSDLSYQFTLV